MVLHDGLVSSMLFLESRVFPPPKSQGQVEERDAAIRLFSFDRSRALQNSVHDFACIYFSSSWKELPRNWSPPARVCRAKWITGDTDLFACLHLPLDNIHQFYKELPTKHGANTNASAQGKGPLFYM